MPLRVLSGVRVARVSSRRQTSPATASTCRAASARVLARLRRSCGRGCFGELAALQRRGHQPSRARCEVGNRVVIEDDAVARAEQNLSAVPAYPSHRAKFEIAHRIRFGIDLHAFGLDESPEHRVCLTFVKVWGCGLHAWFMP